MNTLENLKSSSEEFSAACQEYYKEIKKSHFLKLLAIVDKYSHLANSSSPTNSNEHMSAIAESKKRKEKLLDYLYNATARADYDELRTEEEHIENNVHLSNSLYSICTKLNPKDFLSLEDIDPFSLPAEVHHVDCIPVSSIDDWTNETYILQSVRLQVENNYENNAINTNFKSSKDPLSKLRSIISTKVVPVSLNEKDRTVVKKKNDFIKRKGKDVKTLSVSRKEVNDKDTDVKRKMNSVMDVGLIEKVIQKGIEYSELGVLYNTEDDTVKVKQDNMTLGRKLRHRPIEVVENEIPPQFDKNVMGNVGNRGNVLGEISPEVSKRKIKLKECDTKNKQNKSKKKVYDKTEKMNETIEIDLQAKQSVDLAKKVYDNMLENNMRMVAIDQTAKECVEGKKKINSMQNMYHELQENNERAIEVVEVDKKCVELRKSSRLKKKLQDEILNKNERIMEVDTHAKKDVKRKRKKVIPKKQIIDKEKSNSKNKEELQDKNADALVEKIEECGLAKQHMPVLFLQNTRPTLCRSKTNKCENKLQRKTEETKKVTSKSNVSQKLSPEQESESYIRIIRVPNSASKKAIVLMEDYSIYPSVSANLKEIFSRPLIENNKKVLASATSYKIYKKMAVSLTRIDEETTEGEITPHSCNRIAVHSFQSNSEAVSVLDTEQEQKRSPSHSRKRMAVNSSQSNSESVSVLDKEQEQKKSPSHSRKRMAVNSSQSNSEAVSVLDTEQELKRSPSHSRKRRMAVNSSQSNSEAVSVGPLLDKEQEQKRLLSHSRKRTAVNSSQSNSEAVSVLDTEQEQKRLLSHSCKRMAVHSFQSNSEAVSVLDTEQEQKKSPSHLHKRRMAVNSSQSNSEAVSVLDTEQEQKRSLSHSRKRTAVHSFQSNSEAVSVPVPDTEQEQKSLLSNPRKRMAVQSFQLNPNASSLPHIEQECTAIGLRCNRTEHSESTVCEATKSVVPATNNNVNTSIRTTLRCNDSKTAHEAKNPGPIGTANHKHSESLKQVLSLNLSQNISMKYINTQNERTGFDAAVKVVAHLEEKKAKEVFRQDLQSGKTDFNPVICASDITTTTSSNSSQLSVTHASEFLKPDHSSNVGLTTVEPTLKPLKVTTTHKHIAKKMELRKEVEKEHLLKHSSLQSITKINNELRTSHSADIHVTKSICKSGYFSDVSKLSGSSSKLENRMSKCKVIGHRPGSNASSEFQYQKKETYQQPFLLNARSHDSLRLNHDYSRNRFYSSSDNRFPPLQEVPLNHRDNDNKNCRFDANNIPKVQNLKRLVSNRCTDTFFSDNALTRCNNYHNLHINNSRVASRKSFSKPLDTRDFINKENVQMESTFNFGKINCNQSSNISSRPIDFSSNYYKLSASESIESASFHMAKNSSILEHKKVMQSLIKSNLENEPVLKYRLPEDVSYHLERSILPGVFNTTINLSVFQPPTKLPPNSFHRTGHNSFLKKRPLNASLLPSKQLKSMLSK